MAITITDETILPEFPLIPASRGFCITLRKTLATFKNALVREGIIKSSVGLQLGEIAKESADPSHDSLNSARGESSKNPSYDQPEHAKPVPSKVDLRKSTDSNTTTSLDGAATCETKKDCAERNAS